MFRLLLAVPLLVAGLNSSPSHLRSGPIRTSVTKYGVTFSLSVPRESYPTDALVRVIMRIHNDTQSTIWESGVMSGQCHQQTAVVEVIDSHGRVMSPLPPSSLPALPCPFPPLRPLHPGETFTQVDFAVLLSGTIRASANVNTRRNSRNYFGADIRTPVIRLSLYGAKHPHARFGIHKGVPFAILQRPAGATGPLHYQGWATCGAYPGFWLSTRGDRINAPCEGTWSWHVVAGWVGHRVAIIDGPHVSG